MTQVITKNSRKLLIGTFLVSLFILALTIKVQAQSTATGSAVQNDNAMNSAAFSALAESKRQIGTKLRVKFLIAAADRLINVRVNSLNRLSNRVGSLQNINQPDQQAILTDLATSVDALSSLKVKIDADTDLAILRTDVKSIFSTYRIFMVVMPRDYGLLISYRAAYEANRLRDLESKIQGKIDAAKGKNLATSEVETLLTDFKSQVETADTALTNSESKFSAMKPTDTAAARKLLSLGKTNLSNATKDLKAAKADLEKIIEGLKNLKTKTASPSSSP